MTKFTPRKSSPRLSTFEYKGAYGYFVTINTDGREASLRGQFGARCVELLIEAAESTEFEVIAYCVMPDHVHLLACGLGGSSDLVRFVQRFKQLTGFEYKKATGRQLWQRSYYDHVLRDEDDIDDIAAYIWLNPVKAGLVASATDFEFSGPPHYLGRLSDRAEAVSLRDGDAERWDREAGH